MNDFLDSWTTVRKVPKEFRAARHSAKIGQPGFKSARDLYDVQPSAPVAPLPIEDTKYILEHGKKAWRANKRPARNGDLTYTADGYPIVPFCGQRT